MNKKLAALLVAGLTITVGGLTYLIATPERGTTRVELVDAGILENCTPVVVECQVRNLCQQLPDGGLRPRYGTLQTKAMKCPMPAGRPQDFALVLRWPKKGGEECYDVIGSPETACTITDATCADPTLCPEDPSGEQPVRQAQDRCACVQTDAGVCNVRALDGGMQPGLPGSTYPAPFNGPGCVRKSCEEISGEQGLSWPAQCPLK